VLLAGRGDESPDAVGLIARCLNDPREGGAIGPTDHLQDLRGVALGARLAVRAVGFGSLIRGLGFLLQRGGFGFATLAPPVVPRVGALLVIRSG